LGDETLFTCKGGTRHGYTVEGGHDKPGWWLTDKIPDVIKLIRTDPKTGSFPFFDIQTITQFGKGKYSLVEGCEAKEIFDLDVLDLDKAFVVTCKDMISAYLFYTRNGVPQLLVSHLSLRHASAGAAVTAAKDCKPGD
jgi:hypothetical protein